MSPRTLRLRRPRGLRAPWMAALLAVGTAFGCSSRSVEAGAPGASRSEPVCAVQDCARGVTLDNGCDRQGRCLSCINACPSLAPAVSDEAATRTASGDAERPRRPGDYRSVAECAVIDAQSGKVIDDGCDIQGRCLDCLTLRASDAGAP